MRKIRRANRIRTFKVYHTPLSSFTSSSKAYATGKKGYKSSRKGRVPSTKVRGTQNYDLKKLYSGFKNLPSCPRERNRTRKQYLQFRASRPPRLKSKSGGSQKRFTMRKCV
jgi:hypothetical protein